MIEFKQKFFSVLIEIVVFVLLALFIFWIVGLVAPNDDSLEIVDLDVSTEIPFVDVLNRFDGVDIDREFIDSRKKEQFVQNTIRKNNSRSGNPNLFE